MQLCKLYQLLRSELACASGKKTRSFREKQYVVDDSDSKQSLALNFGITVSPVWRFGHWSVKIIPSPHEFDFFTESERKGHLKWTRSVHEQRY